MIFDSSGIKALDRAALRAIKQWKYNPAMVDGEAIEQCQNKVQSDFKIKNPKKAVRRKFRSAYIKVRKALDANELPLRKSKAKPRVKRQLHACNPMGTRYLIY